MVPAVNVEIRAASSPGEVRVALLRDGKLAEYALWRPGAPDGVGDVHRGRVLRHMPAMAGAFVALVEAEGFLPDSEGGKGLTEGTLLPVRITRAAQGGKGPRLSARIPGRDPGVATGDGVALLSRGPNAIARFADQHRDAPILVDDLALLAELRPHYGARVDRTIEVFDESLLTAIDALAEPHLTLPSGARLSIYPTPALTAIDVDAGAALAAGGRRAERHAAVNQAVIPAVADQIRLRNLSGAIVIDLAGLPIRRRVALGPDIETALAADSLRPRFLGFSALGLAEVLRPRVHPPLHELLAGPHAAGLAALRAVAAESAAQPSLRIELRAAPPVVMALQKDEAALAALARQTGRVLSLIADPAMRPDEWRMEARDE